MSLIDLAPRWVRVQDSSAIIGMTFDCPCCFGKENSTRLAVYFVKDVIGDHGEAIHIKDMIWEKTGSGFNDLTLSPSIDASDHGHWHGFIQNGDVK